MVQKRENKRIVLTAGHAATTGLSVVEQIGKRSGNWDVYWIGAKRSFEGSKAPTLESSALPVAGVKFESLLSGRIQRKLTFWTVPSLLKIPLGAFHALYLLIKIRPSVILSFGGYSSYPVVLMGWMLRIPVIIHEQTCAVGRANRYASFFAKKIALARHSSLKYFPAKKTVVLGNPILDSITKIKPKTMIGNPPVLYVTGGSRGSSLLNEALSGVLREVLQEFRVIHQTGYLDLDKFQEIKKRLPRQLAKRYLVYGTIDPAKIASIYNKADMLLSRAGANTVSEIIITKRPSILIPIPFTYLNEQMKNARFAKDFGIAIILEQKNLTPKILLDELKLLKQKWKVMVEKTRHKKSNDYSASEKLVDEIERIVGN